AAALFVILAAVFWIRPDIYQRSSDILSQYFKDAPKKSDETSLTLEKGPETEPATSNDPMP
ncbi:MAG: hypothetical protein JRJ54_14930, partial [Deltaproteobacteria bacterium]|nr:hypothetical protein [Deltaproteobacteria bacterium]